MPSSKYGTILSFIYIRAGAPPARACGICALWVVVVAVAATPVGVVVLCSAPPMTTSRFSSGLDVLDSIVLSRFRCCAEGGVISWREAAFGGMKYCCDGSFSVGFKLFVR